LSSHGTFVTRSPLDLAELLRRAHAFSLLLFDSFTMLFLEPCFCSRSVFNFALSASRGSSKRPDFLDTECLLPRRTPLDNIFASNCAPPRRPTYARLLRPLRLSTWKLNSTSGSLPTHHCCPGDSSLSPCSVVSCGERVRAQLFRFPSRVAFALSFLNLVTSPGARHPHFRQQPFRTSPNEVAAFCLSVHTPVVTTDTFSLRRVLAAQFLAKRAVPCAEQSPLSASPNPLSPFAVRSPLGS
jgi:hypothetical protein